MIKNKNNYLVISLIAGVVLLSIFIIGSKQSGAGIIDTDGDGYSDEQEIRAGYSPYNPEPVKFSKSDVDGDGVSDYFEHAFGTNPFAIDTDADGYSDFMEIDNAFDPLSKEGGKLGIKVEINLKPQTMSFFVNGIKWREFSVSTGKVSMPTPEGDFLVVSKIEKAWSKSYGLWMPFWLGLDRGEIGIHELPVWPSGYREGENHLGRAVSHGCIRLGVGAAEYVYERINIGDSIKIKP